MAGRYKAYDKLSSTREVIIEDFPEHWTLTRIKFNSLVKARVGWHGLKSDDFTEVGPYLVTGSDFKGKFIQWKNCYHCDEERYEQDPYIQLTNGDLLITKDGTIGKVALVSQLDGKATLNSGVFVVRPLRSDYTTQYYYWLLLSRSFTDFVDYYKTGSTIAHLYQETFVNFKYPLPPYEEQQKIASFLDHETAKIDTLIAKQEKLIELLKEKRQAVISHAVTKGLNPNAPMRDSGVEWLGEVPEHWVVCAIKRELSSLDYRRIPLSADERGKRSGGYRYYGASGVIDHIDDYIFDEPTVLVGEDGANLVNRSTPLAFAAYGQYWVNNHAHILSPKDGLAEYWAEVIEIIDVTPLISGSAQPKLTAEALGNLKIAFPPFLEERETINSFIRSQKTTFDSLIGKAQLQVKLLKERKTALISAAVTGKIDVRHFVSEQGQPQGV
jgi:type I restriction enzyme S subunit